MSTDTEYLGMEDAPEEFMQPKKYRIRFKCNRCQHEYSRIAKSANIPDVPCPKASCKEAIRKEEILEEARKLTQMLEEQRPPAQVGANVNVRAVDMTAEIVMADHKMTDLKDNIRMGEAAAPKLPGQMQSYADNFFNLPKQNAKRSAQMQRLGQRAIAGAFRNTAINPSSLMGGAKGESGLWKVRDEKVK